MTAREQWKRMVQRAGGALKQAENGKPYIRHMLAQAAICVALLLVALALKSYVYPMHDEVTQALSGIVTTELDVGETLGRLKLVQAMVGNAEAVFGTGSWQKPCDGVEILRYTENGTGCVYRAETSAVYAAGAGSVESIKTCDDGSFAVQISHGGKLTTIYAGLQGVMAAEGDQVEKGQQVGILPAGDSGFLLYFAAQRAGEMIDPDTLISAS